MHLEAKTIIHNRFDLEVIDIKTGKTKQTAQAFNIVLNQFFEYRLKNYRTYNVLSGISVGSGSGTLAVTRTSLFSKRITKESTLDDFVPGYPTSYVKRSIRIETTECNGYDLTEVGVVFHHTSFSQYLMTHAMLQDSEGNPIVIHKTDTDVVIVSSTVYCTFTPSGFGTNAEYPPAEDNKIIRWLLLGETFNRVCLSRWNRPLAKLSYGGTVGSNSLGLRSGELAVSLTDGSTDRWQQGYLDLPMVQWNDNVQIPRLVTTIGVPGVGAIHLPDTGIFPNYAVNDLQIGTGDAARTEFNIRAPVIVPNSESIYVDDVLQTRGVDYEIDYESNCDNDLRHALTQQYQCIEDNVQFGTYAICSTITYNGYFDPAVEGAYYIEIDHPEGQYTPLSIQINSTNPIIYDFKSSVSCNRFAILASVADSVFDTMQVFVSDDNENWTQVQGLTRDGTSVWFPLTSGRFWKLYPTTSWTYQLTSNWSISGNSTLPSPADFEKAIFFLGKWVPGLKFYTPPASGAEITASYELDRPYHTMANIMRFTFSIKVQRE
ncbi:MAG: hypothetical protein WC340_18005 [Kiritimatiellia bacterium]